VRRAFGRAFASASYAGAQQTVAGNRYADMRRVRTRWRSLRSNRRTSTRARRRGRVGVARVRTLLEMCRLRGHVTGGTQLVLVLALAVIVLAYGVYTLFNLRSWIREALGRR